MRNLHRLVLIALTSALLDGPALGWERDFPGGYYSAAHTVAVTHGGDVVAGGHLSMDLGGMEATVMKLDGATGATAWEQIFVGEARQIIVDPRDDTIIAGWMAHKARFTVMKLAGEGGEIRWRRGLGKGGATAVATDADGDIIAAGAGAGAGAPGWLVVKLSTNGRDRWRHLMRAHRGHFGGGGASAVAVDPGGDVVAAGVTVETGAYDGVYEDVIATRITVVKLAGRDGHQLWRTDLAEATGGVSGVPNAMRIDPAGDVVIAGVTGVLSFTDSAFTVVKLAGASGKELWRHTIAGRRNAALDVAVDDDGDVVAVGNLDRARRTQTDFAAVKLDGGDGDELWRVAINGTANSDDSATSVAFDSGGAAVVGGFVTNATTGLDFEVVRLAQDGMELARHEIATGSVDIASTLAIGADDRIVAGGETSNDGRHSAFSVVTFP